MCKPKLFITTTVGQTLFFFKEQPQLWKEHFDVCAIAGNEQKLKEFVNSENIRGIYMPMHREISLLSDLKCLFLWIWLLIKEHPYVVHGNTPKAGLLSMVAAWLTFRPVRIYMCHGLRYQTTKGILRKVLMSMEWLSCSCATNVICVSEGVKRQLEVDGLLKKGKGKVVGFGTAGGIDTERFSRQAIEGLPEIRIELNIPKEDFVFCFVGRIVKDKGINELVEAFDRLSQKEQVHLLLVGPKEDDMDPISEKTCELIERNKHIYAVGRQNDVRPYLAASDAFVLPSYREGVGMALLEANAMSVPCIASDIIGCNDVVIPMVNGELVEPMNLESLYNKMKDWVDNRDYVSKLAKGCRSYVLTRYKKENVINDYLCEYKTLAGIN